ncbi:MAG: hypothetical protein C3F02_00415 [Parcubacteria group bacterium]|nr:MAG: hypothetical protein C3F02_00415 [Parcubacteria group bacterium]
MISLANRLEGIIKLHRGEDLVEKLFLFVKDNVNYKFGDWTLEPQKVLRVRNGMCTTKSRLLHKLLSDNGFETYYKILRINARRIFGRFTITEIANYLSENSVHFFVVVKYNSTTTELDCSIDRDLEKKIKLFGYEYDHNWSMPNDYINFIDKKYLIDESGLVKNIDSYTSRKISYKNRLKFFISNVCLDYIRNCNPEDFHGGRISKEIFFSWLKKKNFFYYLIFLVLVYLKK